MIRWNSLAPAVLLAAGACVASKSDIRLLQDDIRATRSLIIAQGDSARRRDQDIRAQIVSGAADALAVMARLNDSVRALSQRQASFAALTSGQLDQLVKDVIQTQALLGQTQRNLQQMRAQAEAARDAANAAATAPVPASGDTTARPAAGVPGAATLFQNAYTQLKQGGFQTSRRGFEEILKNYPNSDEAPGAQLYIGEAFEGERNQAAADSVYRLVVERYPKTPAAPTALYKQGMMLWNANKRTEARRLFQRVVNEYPSADEVHLARGMLNR
jgi:tol-pal system protein YbgF